MQPGPGSEIASSDYEQESPSDPESESGYEENSYEVVFVPTE